MAAAGSGTDAASSSSEPPFDVFLSFRGPDARNKIISHLYAALDRKKIKTYFDEDSLKRGEIISPALYKAIERSLISVIVFSKDYASSTWCLRELVHILDCHGENVQTGVLPIFYEVDPSDLRNQRGPSDIQNQPWIYYDAFRKHEEKFKDDPKMVQGWRDALKRAADIAGYNSLDIRYRPEAKLVDEVVEDILERLSSTVSSDDDLKGLFGFKYQFNEIESLLSIGSPKPNVVTLGIWGMGGMGKTTLADKIFNRFKSQFHGCCFLYDVREESEKKGLKKLPDELYAKLLKEENVNSEDSTIKRRLRRSKVLIILDDVSTSKQLESLIGDDVSDFGERFGSGSRIIITTRDVKVVRAIGADDEITIYEVKQLNDSEGIELFNLKAFKGNSRASDYIDLSRQVVKKVGGNPLAIKVLGSHLGSLRSQSKENWETELEKLKLFPLADIDKVLRISYEGLDEMDQNIFLDIACFFKGYWRGRVENLLNACDFFASNGIDNLIDKSLISQNSDDELHMHDLVQEIGWKIVNDKSKDPGQRTRLWNGKDICDVLKNDKGSEKIEGILLNTRDPWGSVFLEPKAFQRMRNLRFLIIICSYLNPEVDLKALEYLPPLKYLRWDRYPLTHLPSNFETRFLVELDLWNSNLEKLWPGGDKDLNALKIIDLKYSGKLIQIPDLSRALNLEGINLEGCSNLLEFPWHNLQNLDKLVDLNLNACKKVRCSMSRIDGRTLQNIHLYGCSSFDTLPVILTTSLVSLRLSSSSIKELPSSICSLENLSKLEVQHCKHLTNIPSSMREMESLKSVCLNWCSSLETFPEFPRSIEEIKMCWTAIKEVPFSSIEDCFSLGSINISCCGRLESLPTNISKLRSLRELLLTGCSNLRNLPEISEPMGSLRFLYLDGTGIRQLPSGIGNLICLENLSLKGCENLEYVPNSICNLRSLTYLDMSNCKNLELLPELPLSLTILSARGCASLVSTKNTALIQGFWGSYEITRETREFILFENCLKLDEKGRQNIATDFKLRVLRMATRFVPSEDQVLSVDEDEFWYPGVNTCLPGDEIPEWFNHQSDGSSIQIKLPPQWHNDNFLGFALCAVVGDSHSFDKLNKLYCELNLKANNDRRFYFTYHDTQDMIGRDEDFDSDHMLMWYRTCNYHCCLDAEEASFSFFFQEHGRNVFGRIKKCGIRVLYRQDVDEFSSTNNQDLLEQSAAHIPDQPEPSAQENIIDDSEAPTPKKMKV